MKKEELKKNPKRKIISVTGTKGKTTIVRLLDEVYKSLGEETLRVDNDGYFFNGKIQGDSDWSLEQFGSIPTICPGKFLLSLKNKPKALAIFEVSVGSSGLSGLGYLWHSIGIFTNVYEDHITGRRIKNRNDILDAKSFIAKRIRPNGSAILNGDDKYVAKSIKDIPEYARSVFYGITLAAIDKKKCLAKGSILITLEDSWVVAKQKSKTQKLVNIEKVPFTFGGRYAPSVYNVLAVCAAVYSDHNGHFPKKAKIAIESYTQDKDGARLVVLKKKKRTIILDFAHEKHSLREVFRLGKTLGRNCYGVIRLDSSRNNDVVEKTGAYIAKNADEFFVWDKIDGVRSKKFSIDLAPEFSRQIGETSKLLTNAIHSSGGKATNCLQEEKSIFSALKASQPGDSIVIIVGDDKEYTMKALSSALARVS